MTTARLNGFALLLWLLSAALIGSIAINAAHFTPWEFLVPQKDPVTWIAPALIFAPPLLLLGIKGSAPKVQSSIAWAVTSVLALAIIAIFSLFSPSAYLGS